MKTFDQLTTRQQFIRLNLVRLIIYGGFAAALIWSISEMIDRQERANASVQRVEDVMIDFYRETKGRKDTVGMTNYMKLRLTPSDYRLWVRSGNDYYKK